MGDNFETIMTSYFEDFKKSMKQRMRRQILLVEQYYNDICFLVDIHYTYIQDITPRVRWLRPLGYEIIVDEALATIIALLVEEVDKNAKIFGNYDVMKSKVERDLKFTSTLKKKDKLMKNIKARIGEGTCEEDDDDDEVDVEEEQGQAQEPLALTQGFGEME